MYIDLSIVLIFLAITLGVGIYHGKKVSSIKEFALGDRSFNTATLVATIVATWTTGDDFFVLVSETYEHGLYFIISALLGVFIVLLVTGMVFVPRMGEFLGDLTIAESMGKMYGRNVRIITVFAGCIGTIGIIATQFTIAGKILEYSLGIPAFYGVAIGAIIVTIYSSFGGIKSVTFTDLIQFFTFGTIMPSLAVFIFHNYGYSEEILEALNHHPNFDLNNIFDFSSDKSQYFLFLFAFMALPSFDPAIFQRISMSQNVFQAKTAFIYAGFVSLFFGLTVSCIGAISIIAYPDASAADIAQRILMDYSYTGLKGLLIISILAMMMSSADSFINSASVLFTHDLCESLNIKLKNELLVSRITSCFIGFGAFLLSLRASGLLELMIKTKSFYMPVVSVPFIFSILGFRSSSKSVLMGMAAGVVTVIFCELFIENIISAIPGMLANTLFLFASHYLLKQPGGWVGIKDYVPVRMIRNARRAQLFRILKAIGDFDVEKFLEKNRPKDKRFYQYFGIFALFSTYFASYTLPQNTITTYAKITDLMYPIAFILSTALVVSPAWIERVKANPILARLWIFSLMYILIFVGLMQVLISQFHQFQMVIFILNFLVLSILARWQLVVFNMILGCALSCIFFVGATGESLIPADLNIEFIIAYLLLFMSLVLIAFVKPNQDLYEENDEQGSYDQRQFELKD